MQVDLNSTREQFPLSPKKIIKKTLTDIIGSLFSIAVLFFVVQMLLGVYLTIFMPDTKPALSLARGILIFLLCVLPIYAYVYQRWYFVKYFYDLTDHHITIRKGVLTPHEITIPYERIQDIYMDQDLFDRLLGLYDVHFSSATITSGREAHIDGLEKQAAHGLYQKVLAIIGQRLEKNKASL